MKKIVMLALCLTLVTACSPKVGSEKWCETLKEKPKADWTANEAKDFASHCLFK